MKTLRKRSLPGAGPRHRSFRRSSSSSIASQYSGTGKVRRAAPPRLRRGRLDIRNRDRQAQLAVIRRLFVQCVAEAREDFTLVARNDLLPGVEKSELDEVVVEEGGAIGKTHERFLRDATRNFEAAGFQRLGDAVDRSAMLDVLAKPRRCFGIVSHDVGENIVELAHVALQVRR